MSNMINRMSEKLKLSLMHLRAYELSLELSVKQYHFNPTLKIWLIIMYEGILFSDQNSDEQV